MVRRRFSRDDRRRFPAMLACKIEANCETQLALINEKYCGWETQRSCT